MFYLPGQGGFFFASESPYRAAIPEGRIHRRQQNAVHRGQSFLRVPPRCYLSLHRTFARNCGSTTTPIIGLRGNWTLQDPEAGSANAAAAEFFTAAADSLDWWMATSPDTGK